MQQRINRNIVECKFGNASNIYFTSQVLIETLWNVNLKRMQRWVNSRFVLIETLWNVNLSIRFALKRISLVLIETLWNVNKKVERYMRCRKFGINRNIVECKCVAGVLHYEVGRSINRNIVECKCKSKYPDKPITETVLIETLWNVNQNVFQTK